MAITRWDPMRELEEMTQRLNRVFGSSLSTRGHERETMSLPDWQPSVDVSETAEGYLIQAELPQVKKEDIKVTVDHGLLRISGERKQEKEEKDKRFHRIERSYGSFMRSFTLPDNVDAENVKADIKDGVLSVQLLKTAQKTPAARNIPVK
jgi:HSP20 family protein